MSSDSERVYTIPLGKVLLSPDNRRAMRAINMIREFARRHMKVSDIRIEERLSHEIWARGIKKPPRKIRVRMSKTDDGHVLVSPYAPDAEKPKEDTRQDKGADSVAEAATSGLAVDAASDDSATPSADTPEPAPGSKSQEPETFGNPEPDAKPTPRATESEPDSPAKAQDAESGETDPK